MRLTKLFIGFFVLVILAFAAGIIWRYGLAKLGLPTAAVGLLMALPFFAVSYLVIATMLGDRQRPGNLHEGWDNHMKSDARLGNSLKLYWNIMLSSFAGALGWVSQLWHNSGGRSWIAQRRRLRLAERLAYI